MKGKTKNIILLLGFLITCFICYRFAISNTLEAYTTYKKLEQENLLFKNIPKQQVMLKKQNVYLDSLLNKYQIGGTSIQNNLLKNLNTNSDSLGLKLVEFEKAHVFEKKQLTINSHIFTLEGSYGDLLKLIYNLEQRTKFGEVVHVGLEKKKDLRTREERLEGNIIVQHY
ncbi:hypothetical protein HX109_10905 [Galbibacter sp. BG1]|uniref:hypothetical protein n=1 Tax=Galbibacter sp. BG1 TaxID=1170699 RepID=UPI0015BE092D|nr:hypothetical protein [Galbibacter sp. BG1]QLE02037.1 hypothetical protein HX109_10905 [Galbibacter sp. BG1]